MIPIVGLTNDNSVCYLNSLLQCLMANDKFNIELKVKDPEIENLLNSYICLLNGITRHFKDLQRVFKVNPSGFKKVLFSDSKFVKGHQEDADELLVHFLDKIGDNSFKTVIRTYTKCFSCGHSNHRDETMCQIYLNVPHGIDDDGVHSCLNNYIKPESLIGYKCDNCGSKDGTKKALLPIDFGDNVVFVMKQYQTNYRKMSLKVINEIDLGTYLFDKDNKKQRIVKKYNLVGGILHFGNRFGGHYQAICKKDSKWYLFDDETVEEISDSLQLGSAYMLFYEISSSE